MHNYVTARKVAIPVNVAAKTWDLSLHLLVVFARVIVTDGCGRKPYEHCFDNFRTAFN